MNRTFMVNNVQFKFEDANDNTGRGIVALKIEFRQLLITSTISAAQADAIGNVFKAVARNRGFKEKE